MKCPGFSLLGLVLFVLSGRAQTPELTAFLDKADLATTQYQRIFKNLVSEELKTYEYLRTDGSVEDTRRIKSIFIIYQSPKSKLVAEFRNITEFNGKNVERTDKDVAKFFEKLSAADSSGEEVRRLAKEGNRFDGKSESYGMTLIQAFVLNRFFRPFFEFRIVAHEKIDGRDVAVVEYKQVKPSPNIQANATDEEKKEKNALRFDTDLPPNLRPTNPRLQGRMWIDAENARLWRHEFTVTIQPAILSSPVVSTELNFEYRQSEFGVLLPGKLSIVSYRFAGRSEKDLKRTKTATKTFEYSKFSKAAAEIKDAKTGN